jgi:hypothetical protein
MVTGAATEVQRNSGQPRSLLAILATPRTRVAARPPARFSQRLVTVPRSVTRPLLADTSIVSLLTRGSQESSATTSRRRSSSFIAGSFHLGAGLPGHWLLTGR